MYLPSFKFNTSSFGHHASASNGTLCKNITSVYEKKQLIRNQDY